MESAGKMNPKGRTEVNVNSRLGRSHSEGMKNVAKKPEEKEEICKDRIEGEAWFLDYLHKSKDIERRRTTEEDRMRAEHILCSI
jgi:hypothetical protein